MNSRRSSVLSLLVVSMLPVMVASACAKPSPTGVALDRAIREPSGLTASANYPGVFWVHGDSGTGNWLFAVDRDGKLLARLRVKGAENVDWEDITHDDGGHLWIGDIGNNDSSRRDLVVHRIVEPDPHAGLTELEVDRSVHYSFPEQTEWGNKFADFDAESLMWWDGQLWLLTKHRSDDRTWLYRFPSLDGESVELERVVSFDLGPSLVGERSPWAGQATAAEVASDGQHWALLSYDAVFVWGLPPIGSESGASMFAAPITRINFDREQTNQIEGLTWDGPELLLINEDRHVFRIADPLTTTQYP